MLRQRRGWSEDDLAVFLRLPRRNIVAYERGQTLPRAYTLYLLSRIFRLEIGSFLEDHSREREADDVVRLAERVRAIPLRHRRVLLRFLETLLGTMERLF